MLNADWMHK